MTLKDVIRRQYQHKIDQAASQLKNTEIPPEGWICTVRKALGMSAAALARRLNKTRALVSNTEKAEIDGNVTLKTMTSMAEAMNCRFLYAVVPKENVEDILTKRAQKKASQIVLKSSSHMALENQTLNQKQIDFEIERITSDMLKNQPFDFWNNE